MELSLETRRLLDQQALQLRSEILYDLAAAHDGIELRYDPATWDARAVLRELTDLHRAVRSLFAGADWPLRVEETP